MVLSLSSKEEEDMTRFKRAVPVVIIIAALAATAGLVWDIHSMRPPSPNLARVTVTVPAEQTAPAAATAPVGAQPAKEAEPIIRTALPDLKPAAADDPGEAMPEPPIRGAQIDTIDEDAGEAARQCPGYSTGVLHLPSYNGNVDATHRLVAGRWFYCYSLPGP